jgi:hypothetical protein
MESRRLAGIHSLPVKSSNWPIVRVSSMNPCRIFSHSLSCAGNPHLRTPNFDALAAGGVRFDCAYSSNPVCRPARVSMMTGY